MSDEIVPGETPAPDCWSSQAKSPGAAEDQMNTGGNSSGRAERFASLGALLSAFIASSWCWLPALLILGGISGAGMMTLLENYRPVFMVVTFGLLGSAFYLTYRPRTSAGSGAPVATNSRRATMLTFNKIVLWVVTVMVVVMLFFPQAVPSRFASSSRFTADMQRTVIQIEGMTWHTWAPKAEKAIETAPGVLAVKVDYETGLATVGTKAGSDVPTSEILAAIESLGYRAEVVKQPP